ncbi:sortase domain-containing protein [Streptomyces sp. QTS137]
MLEGTETGTLRKGPGHHANTARLGREGDFAVAGHRRTHGDPFEGFPRFWRGDAVVPAEGTTRFAYRVDRGPCKTVPTDIEVIGPVPRTSGYTRPVRCPSRRRANRNGGAVTG